LIVDGTFLQGATQPPVLIIGSGPAGTSLALRLAQHGTGALVLEAGPEEYSDDSQEFYTGEIFGDGYYDLDATRLRHFGGSSNHWEGWCRPLDARDFERREDVPHTGWPIGKADLDPFLEDAAGILEVAPPGEHALSDDLVEVGFSQSRWCRG
jgi:choline dehydrogenase-like flavoprotein